MRRCRRANRDATRRRFGLPLSQPVLLNVGRLAAQKNQDVLVRALACLPQAHLVLAGAGPRRESFHTLAVTLGVDDRLHMLGALPAEDIADLYAAADLFVFPSTWETFGLAAVEAAMVGMPMVVADLPVLHEVLRAEAPKGWLSSVHMMSRDGFPRSARRLSAVPAGPAGDAFARAICRKYSRQRMIESYLSLFEAYRRPDRGEMAGFARRLRGEARS